MSCSLLLKSKYLPRDYALSWLVCLSAGLFFFYEFFQLNIFDVINQSLRDDFHLDAAQISWMSSAYLWADILFLLPAGVILDRFSTRAVILYAMMVCILGTLGFALTSSYWLACFFHFLSGVGNAFCFLTCMVLIAQWFPPNRQAFVVGMIVTMAFLGGMAAHTPFAFLNEQYGWRNSLLIDGILGIIILGWIALTVHEKPGHSKLSGASSGESLKTDLALLIRNRHIWLGGIYTAVLNLPIMVLGALWGASYLQSVHHLSEMAASNIVSLIYMGSIIGCPLAGWLSDTHQRRKPTMVLGAIGTLLFLFPLLWGSTFSTFYLSMVFFGLGFFSSTQVISYPLIAESNKASNTGAATGLASVLIMGLAGAGQILFGGLLHYHNQFMQQYTILDYQYAMRMFPIAAVLSLVCILLTQETYCKRLESK